MDQETKARPVRRRGAGRPGGRRAVALTGVVLAVAVAAGCGSGGSGASDGAAPTAPAAPSVSAPAEPGSTSPSPAPSAPDPRPMSPSASPVAPAPPTPGTGATPGIGPDGPQPTGPGIAPGEPAPVPGGRQTIGYQLSGNRLTVWFYGGICEKYGLKTDESRPGRVDVRIVVATPIAPGTSCAAVAKRQSVTADLKGPLMGRAVMDAANGAEVPLEAEVAGGPPAPADK
ncbi:hypothetical protein [Kitasatospora sp. NPDC057015]|uniref:hypothetical protein n=1 Tax=Kitasatospora sp. NPDC057015 TaxID=3346001 RepID=UPI00362F4FDF